MTSLFLRIFLSFWLAMGLIVAGAMTLATVAATHPDGVIRLEMFMPGHVPILMLLLLAFAVSAPVCWVLARSISRPVEALRGHARELAAGRLDARAPASVRRRRDELGGLARDFDAMACRLQSLLGSRDLLLRDVSHELRSPLARLRVALDLARRRDDRLPLQLDRIEREGENLDALIGQLLQLARQRDAGALPDHADHDVALDRLLGEIVRDACFEARDHGKQVCWRQPPAAMVVRGDPAALRSAFENVVRNAVRFTAPDTSVDVHASAAGGYWVVEVSDRGPGVPPEHLARIFEPFHRVESARDRRSGGTGLGLAIAAGVAARHGGSIRADNRSDGPGLAVRIELPRSDCAGYLQE